MKKILIIEDEKAIQDELVRVASSVKNNVNISTATKCSTAERLCKSEQFDALFVDIQLEDGSGLEFVKKLREKQEYAFVPIVFITGMLTAELEAFRQTHCYDFVTKPFGRQRLQSVFEKILLEYFGEKERESYVRLDLGGAKRRVMLNDVLFAEMVGRKIEIQLRHERIIYKSMSMKKFCMLLPHTFIQVHQSIIVNSAHIYRYDSARNTVKVSGYSKELPVGPRFKKNMGVVR